MATNPISEVGGIQIIPPLSPRPAHRNALPPRSFELFECSNISPGRTRKFAQRLAVPTAILVPARAKRPDELCEPRNLRFAVVRLSDEEARSVPDLGYPALTELVGAFQVLNALTAENISLPCRVLRGNTFASGQDQVVSECPDCGWIEPGDHKICVQCHHGALIIENRHTPGPQVKPFQRVRYPYEESTWPTTASFREASFLKTTHISSATCQCSGCLADHPERKTNTPAEPRKNRWFAGLFGPFPKRRHEVVKAQTFVARSTELHHRVYGCVEAFASASPQFNPRLEMPQSESADALLFKLADGSERLLIVNEQYFSDDHGRLSEVLAIFSGQTFTSKHKPASYTQWKRKRTVYKAEQIIGDPSDFYLNHARVSCNKPTCKNNPLCPHALSEEAFWIECQAHRVSIWRKSTPHSPRLSDPVGFVPPELRYTKYCFGKHGSAPTEAQMLRQFNPDGSLRIRMADVYGRAESGAHQNADYDVSDFEGVDWEFSDSSRGTDWNDIETRLSELEKAGSLDSIEALLTHALNLDDQPAPDKPLPPFYATEKYSNSMDLAQRQKLLKYKKLLRFARAMIQLGTWSKNQACLDGDCRCCLLDRRCAEVFTENAKAGTSWKHVKSMNAVAKRLRWTYSQARDTKDQITRMTDTYFGKWLHSTYGRPLPRDNSAYYLQLLSRLLASYRTFAGAPIQVIDSIGQQLPTELQNLGYQGERLFQEVGAECRTVLVVTDDLPHWCNCCLYHYQHEATAHCVHVKNRGWPVRRNN